VGVSETAYGFRAALLAKVWVHVLVVLAPVAPRFVVVAEALVEGALVAVAGERHDGDGAYGAAAVAAAVAVDDGGDEEHDGHRVDSVPSYHRVHGRHDMIARVAPDSSPSGRYQVRSRAAGRHEAGRRDTLPEDSRHGREQGWLRHQAEDERQRQLDR